jgi:hypothetical protein
MIPMNLNGLRDLLASERGIYAVALAVCSAVLVYLDKMAVQQWLDFNLSLAYALIGSKTVTTAVEIAKRPAAPATVETSTVTTMSASSTKPPE